MVFNSSNIPKFIKNSSGKSTPKPYESGRIGLSGPMGSWAMRYNALWRQGQRSEEMMVVRIQETVHSWNPLVSRNMIVKLLRLFMSAVIAAPR